MSIHIRLEVRCHGLMVVLFKCKCVQLYPVTGWHPVQGVPWAPGSPETFFEILAPADMIALSGFCRFLQIWTVDTRQVGFMLLTTNSDLTNRNSSDQLMFLQFSTVLNFPSTVLSWSWLTDIELNMVF